LILTVHIGIGTFRVADLYIVDEIFLTHKTAFPILPTSKSKFLSIKLGAGAYVKKPYEMETIGLAIRDELNRQD